MTSSKWAPDNEQGQHAYLRTRTSWGRTTVTIVYADNLADAKREYGWERAGAGGVSIKLRRATPADVEEQTR